MSVSAALLAFAVVACVCAARAAPLPARAATVMSLGCLIGLAGCAGGAAPNHCFPGDQQCGRLIAAYEVEALAWQTPNTPIPIGSSVTVSFHERRCVGSGQQGQPPPGVGCDPWYEPSTLTAIVQPLGLQPNGLACPVTVAETKAGTFRFTRTGPGDPIIGAGNANATGYCVIYVSDPKTASDAISIYL
jgi:hypothetical protein